MEVVLAISTFLKRIMMESVFIDGVMFTKVQLEKLVKLKAKLNPQVLNSARETVLKLGVLGASEFYSREDRVKPMKKELAEEICHLAFLIGYLKTREEVENGFKTLFGKWTKHSHFIKSFHAGFYQNIFDNSDELCGAMPEFLETGDKNIKETEVLLKESHKFNGIAYVSLMFLESEIK